MFDVAGVESVSCTHGGMVMEHLSCFVPSTSWKARAIAMVQVMPCRQNPWAADWEFGKP